MLPKNKINNILTKLPQKPGVYIFKNGKKNILYVGKAKNIKKRVNSYFIKNKELSADKKLMLPKIKKIDYIVADSELEALLLESNLIKKEKPRYNVILKDDKQYQYIKIDKADDFPKIYTARKIEKDQASYYGPFTNGLAVKNTLNLLNKLFPYRECNLEIYEHSKKRKVCLKYHIQRCLGPCAHYISKKDYAALIKQSELFLRGRQDKILSQLRKDMKFEASKKNFEKAAAIRDQIFNLEEIIEKQKVISTKKIDQDFISYYQKNNLTIINLFMVRHGKLIGKENFNLKTKNKKTDEILSSFIKLHYLNQKIIPQDIIIQTDIEDKHLITSFLTKQNKRKVNIIIPKTGKNYQLIKLGIKNAQLYYQNLSLREKLSPQEKSQIKLLRSTKKILKLKDIPKRIECYDISNIQGTHATGSMVVFENGLPAKNQYRHFRINFPSISDTDMMKEMLSRRFKNYQQDKIIAQEKWPLPNLIVIDGGKGQLNAALGVLKKQKLNVSLISIAKKFEELYSPNSSKPLKLTQTSPTLQLIQRIRDEAHRFAITYHRKLKEKETPSSILDTIPGIGPKKKKKLLKKFRSIANIKNANFKELKNILGEKLAHKIINKLE